MDFAPAPARGETGTALTAGGARIGAHQKGETLGEACFPQIRLQEPDHDLPSPRAATSCVPSHQADLRESRTTRITRTFGRASANSSPNGAAGKKAREPPELVQPQRLVLPHCGADWPAQPYLKPADYLYPLTGAETGAAAGGPNGAPATLSGRMTRTHPRVSCPP
jgi:hypothetical protein